MPRLQAYLTNAAERHATRIRTDPPTPMSALRVREQNPIGMALAGVLGESGTAGRIGGYPLS